MTDIVCDDSQFPYVEVQFPGRVASDEAVAGFLANLDTYQERALQAGRPYVCVIHGANGMTPQQRKMNTDWLDRRDPKYEGTLQKVFIVSESAVVRGVLTAMTWMSPRVKALTAPCKSLDDARQKAMQALEEAGPL